MDEWNSSPYFFAHLFKEHHMSNCRHYGLFNFLVDLTMTLITGGLWLIWIFVREMRHR